MARKGAPRFCEICKAEITEPRRIRTCGKQECVDENHRRLRRKWNKSVRAGSKSKTKSAVYVPKNWKRQMKPEIHKLLTLANPNYRSQQYLTITFCVDPTDDSPADYPALTKYAMSERKRYISIYLQELGWVHRSKGRKSSVMFNPNATSTGGGVVYG